MNSTASASINTYIPHGPSCFGATPAGGHDAPGNGTGKDYLVTWEREHGDTFRIARALRARHPSILTGQVGDGGKVAIVCPNASAHGKAGADRAATFIRDATKKAGFAAYCLHACCVNLHRMDLVRLMLEQGSLARKDLTNPAFLSDDPEPESAGPEQSGVDRPEAAPYGPPTEAEAEAAIAAEIERLRDMSDAAFLLIDREAVAKQLRCKPHQLDGLRKRAQAAKAQADAATPKARLTGDARQAEIERLADLKEGDPIAYDEQRDAAAASIGCRVGILDEAVNKIIADRVAVRLRNQPPPPPPTDTPEVIALLDEFNALYFVVNEQGKGVVYAPKHDPDQNRRFYERIGFADLEKFYLNRKVITGYNNKTGEPEYKPVAHVWLHHPTRRQYIGGIVFDPSPRKHPDNILNLWQGFAVTPNANGSWALLKEHTRTIVCNGNAGYFTWLMDWMADVVQHPEKQGEVAVVMRGIEGTGKGILARAMKYLLGQHGFAISNAKHLTGNFNAHLRDCVLLFADEALYAGDKAHVGILKSIITEPYLTIEGKFQNVAMGVNRLHLMMASNELWVVPASMESRRFFVLDVSTAFANNHEYFAAIQHELENGGYEAMLHELLNRTITSNLRSPPVTDALISQRTLSLDTTTAWWLDVLHRGYVFASELGLEDQFDKWINPISTELLYASYMRFCTAKRERHPLNRVHFGRWLHDVKCKKERPTGDVIVGEHITDAATTTTARSGDQVTHHGRVAEPVHRYRAWSYSVGTLDQARKAFTETTKLAVEWDKEAPDDC